MKQNLPLTILLFLSLVIGFLTLKDYGESWDELKLYDYAADSLEAYGMWPQHGTIPVTGDQVELIAGHCGLDRGVMLFITFTPTNGIRIFRIAQCVF